MPNEVAPEGSIFVCMQCGKRSRDRYGDRTSSPGWDESCATHAILLPESRLATKAGRVTAILPEGRSNDELARKDKPRPG